MTFARCNVTKVSYLLPGQPSERIAVTTSLALPYTMRLSAQNISKALRPIPVSASPRRHGLNLP